MNRFILMLTGISSASSLLLADSAIKGTALLLLVCLAALMMRRDSAARRHLVWLLAILALVAVPILSTVLPQWRVLPQWADISPRATAAIVIPPSINIPADSPIESPRQVMPTVTPPPAAAMPPVPAAEVSVSQPATLVPQKPAAPIASKWRLSSLLPLFWAIGFCILILRLIAARWLLWNSQRRTPTANATADAHILAALSAARLQLGLRQSVALLLYPDKTIPVVFGIFRPQLLLPQSARDWKSDQLKSVLLHELAHVKRGDILVQLLAQLACALHWFNPLAWFAAWRLAVERERACDDLVLSSGVRPSAYAGHLLDAVTTLSSNRWTHACGLAMARKSSIEGRLLAVLSKNQNRRRVSLALAAGALVVAMVVAVPVAMLRAADAKPSATSSTAAPTDKPEAPEKPKPAIDETLKWCQPVNGLRAAMALRPFSDQPKAGDAPELYIAVQNVADAPIRLNDSMAEKQPRMLYLKIDHRIVAGIGAKDPRLGDRVLQPREITFITMYAPGHMPDKKTIGQMMAEDLLKDTHQSMLAHLLIEKAPEGAWTGELITPEVTGAVAAGQPQPKSKEAQALMAIWQHHARLNGMFPGGLIERLGAKMKEFIHNNTGDVGGDSYARKMSPLLERIDSSRDWKPAEVAALMDDIAAITPIPLETTAEEIAQHIFQNGQPLPPKFVKAPWGQTQPSGLRLAWMFEPRAPEYPLGKPLAARILVHNAGKNTVVFRTRNWQQVEHTATNAQGKSINVMSVEWTTLGILTSFRLEPGEYVELHGPGISVGARNKQDPDDWQTIRVGSWIEAKAGDEVTVNSAPVALKDDWNEQPPKAGQPTWWLDFIKAELNQDLPIPADDQERQRIVYRAGMELFGTPLDAQTLASFVSDHQPGAVERLAQRLANRAGVQAFSGNLTSAPTTFRVLPADPEAAKKPRTTTNPGHYTLGDHATFIVSRHLQGDRIVNEARIDISPADPTLPKPSNRIKLPDGYGTWAAAWVRGTTVLWIIRQKEVVAYDFSKPTDLKEAKIDDPANPEKIPAPIFEALRAALQPPAAAEPKASPAASGAQK
jgi:beta-lactamase regulating signal transducer with metallopeptidase domain